MKFLNENQRTFLNKKTIKENSFYMFPRWGFSVFSSHSIDSDNGFVDTNPFTKSLDHEYFYVKQKVNGFLKGNFYNKPIATDFYLLESSLQRRDPVEQFILTLICFIPFFIYNLFTKTKKNTCI